MERHFPRSFDALVDITAFVAEFFEVHSIDPANSFAVEFIIEEIFTNMVKYNRDGQQEIEIQLERVDEQVVIRLTDFNVEEFDITRVPEVDSQKYVAEKKVGGLGLHLVKRMADSVSYLYADSSSKVTIVKSLEKADV